MLMSCVTGLKHARNLQRTTLRSKLVNGILWIHANISHSSCREALGLKQAVYNNPHSTAAEKVVAEKILRFVTDRVKETWTQKRNAELCELSAKDPSQCWKAFLKAPQSNAGPVELSAQFEAFRALMGAEPQSAPQRPADSGVSTACSDDACLNADITVDELSQCIKRLKRGKSPGIDGILADMIKDGGSCAAVPAVAV